MSYDILAFDPRATTDEGFEGWWDEQAQWSESHSYSDPSVSTPALQAFYRDVTRRFPPLAGVVAGSDELADVELLPRLTDYSIGRQIIYGAASWSQEVAVRAEWERLGRRYAVAVAFVSHSPVTILRP